MSGLPTIGSPNTSREKYDEGGDLARRRFYGKEGKAIGTSITRMTMEPVSHMPMTGIGPKTNRVSPAVH